MWAGLLYAVFMNAEVFMVILKEGVTFHSVMLLLVPWLMFVSGEYGSVLNTANVIRNSIVIDRMSRKSVEAK